MTNHMTEERKRIWDVRLGVAGPIVTVAGLLLGVWQFNRGEENKTRLEYEMLAKKDDLEFRRKLWLDRVSTYRTVSELAGNIAAHERKDAKFDGLAESFSGAYWGLMILVEDKDVEQAMIQFYDEIRDYRIGRSDADRIKKRADQLIQTCRKSIEGKPQAQK
jgi:hypothetical protein